MSFTILRDEYKLVKIDLFDINSNEKKRIFIYTCEPFLITSNEKEEYLKSIEKKVKKTENFPSNWSRWSREDYTFNKYV